MDSRAVQTHSHANDEHHPRHNVGLQEVRHGEDHHHDHEKKSVLKKVKAKAKKIKDTITKHGHHDHEHGHGYHYGDQHIPDDHDLDEEDDEDEYMDQDPEIHGAPIYDSAIRSPISGQVNNLGRPGVNLGGTRVMGEAPHHEPRVVVVSPTSQINQSRTITDPTRTVVEEEKRKVNLERPMGLEEDPHAPRSRAEAYAPANYQTKVADPTGTGGAEIDITPVEKSFTRMTVHNEPEPKVLPTIAETHHPSSTIGHHQFVPELSTATKTHYPSTESHGQHMPELSSEVKTQYPKSQDQNFSKLSSGATQVHYPSVGSHDQFNPELSTEPSLSHYAQSHHHNLPQHSSATKSHYPSSGTHDQFVQNPLTGHSTKTHYPSTKSHDQHMPKTQYPLATSHDQFGQDPLTKPKTQYPIGCHDQNMSKTQYPSTGSRDQFVQDPLTQPKIQYPYKNPLTQPEPRTHYPSAKSHDQTMPKTQYPSTGSHDQFVPEFSTQPKTGQTYTTTNITTTNDEEPQIDTPSDQTSYTDKISAATSAIADKAAGAKNTVASKLRFGEKDTTTAQENETTTEKPSNQSSYTEKLSSAIADKAATAKNTVASKLGYGEKDTTTTTQENETTHENPSNQGSYTEKLSMATSAIADKAATAKNAVALKLGYCQNDTTSTQEYETTRENPSNQGSYTEKLSSATTAIADKAATAKNVVASKLGYGEKDTTSSQENETTRRNPSNQGSYTEKLSVASSAIADKAVWAKNAVASKLGFDETREENKTQNTSTGPATEYGKQVASSLTQKLAPVYEKSSREKIGIEQDKGVSMKDYLAEKLRPSEEDRALSEVISETIHKKEEKGVNEGRREGKVLGKVTESEEVKRRLGSDEKTERIYEERYENSAGKGVVDKIKDVVVESWFGNQDDNQPSQGSEYVSRNSEVDQVNPATGGRRPQESSN